MNVLFLHPNFPAQFKHLSKSFVESGHNTVFLCQTHYGREIDGVKKLTLKNDAGHRALSKNNLSIFDRSQKQAEQYRQGFDALKSQGWNPDLVISHSGWGCGLYAKEIWPKAKLISYLEWWFNPESDFFKYSANDLNLNLTPQSTKKYWLRNQQIALELAVANEIVAPTKWQANQLPPTFKNQCNVIFDGIDLSIYKNRPEIKRRKIITYGTRGMDPMRCFPQFVLAAKEFLKENKEHTLEIAGIDEAFYGIQPKNSTWGQWARKEFEGYNVEGRVRWMNRLAPGKYEKWLNSSAGHIYLTHPFVTSWSLVETYCSGTPLLISDIPATNEICSPDEGVLRVDHRHHDKLVESMLQLSESSYANSEVLSKLRAPSRFSVKTALEQWSHVSGVELTTSD